MQLGSFWQYQLFSYANTLRRCFVLSQCRSASLLSELSRLSAGSSWVIRSLSGICDGCTLILITLPLETDPIRDRHARVVLITPSAWGLIAPCKMSPTSVCYTVAKDEPGDLGAATRGSLAGKTKVGSSSQTFGIRKQERVSESPLRVGKDSHRIRKPPLPLPQVQYRPPIIIHTYSPKVIHTQPDDFMSLVQKLTGSSDTRLRLKRKPAKKSSAPASDQNDLVVAVTDLEQQGMHDDLWYHPPPPAPHHFQPFVFAIQCKYVGSLLAKELTSHSIFTSFDLLSCIWSLGPNFC